MRPARAGVSSVSFLRFHSPSVLKLFPLLLFALSLCFPGGAFAARFSLEAAVNRALTHNPDLAAARWKIEEARGRLAQAGRLANPEMEYEFKPNARGREFAVSAAFTQRFPLTNRLRLEKAVSRAELEAAGAEVDSAAQRLKAKVLETGVKLLALDEARRLTEARLRYSREFAEDAEKTAARGEGSPLDAAQFALEAKQLNLELLQLEAERAALAGELRPLLGLEPKEPVEITGRLPAPALPGEAGGDVSGRADWRAAQARVEAARQGAALARAEKWEDVTVGAALEVERAKDAPEGLETDVFAGFRVSIPLPLRNKNEGKIQEADAALARHGMEAGALAAGIRAEAAAALEEMRAAARILESIDQTLLPAARALEEQIVKSWRAAQPDARPADVLRAREKRLSLEQARVDALRNFHLARVRFDAALGR